MTKLLACVQDKMQRQIKRLQKTDTPKESAESEKQPRVEGTSQVPG